MTDMNIHLAALADFVDAMIESNPEFDEPEFAFTFGETRIFCQRKADHYDLEIDNEHYQLPRC